MAELTYDEAVKRHAEYKVIKNEAGDVLYTPPVVSFKSDGTPYFNDGSVFAISGQHPNEYFKADDKGVCKSPEFKRKNETKPGDTPARFGPEDNVRSGRAPSPVTPAAYTPEDNKAPASDPRNITNPGPLSADDAHRGPYTPGEKTPGNNGTDN